MMETQDLFFYPLWNTGKYGYIPIFTRSDVKIYAPDEVEWHEIVFKENPFAKLQQISRECQLKLEECQTQALTAIRAKKKARESNVHVPLLPKTPNLPKRTARKRKITKKRSSFLSTRRSTRSRTRLESRLSAERKSGVVWSDLSAADSLELNSGRRTRSKESSSPPAKDLANVTSELFAVDEVSGSDKNTAENEEGEQNKKQLSVSMQRLSNEQIQELVNNQKQINQQNNEESRQSIEKCPQVPEEIPLITEEKQQTNEENIAKEQDIQLVLSDHSEDFEEEKEIAKKKSVSRKRKSQARLKALVKKRKTLRSSVQANIAEEQSVEKNISSTEMDSASNEESPLKSSTRATARKTTRAKPRIAKPVIRKKDVTAKAERSSGKKKGRTPLSASVTPIRTRQRFMSPMGRTPVNLQSTIKSFLKSNTPEPINKDAVIEAKKKLLEEKQRQGEERQKKIEEEKKQKLAETKKKREERALRAIRMREMKEQQERERQDRLQGIWEQRIEDAKRTKDQQKLIKTAKVTRELEKIAKAGAKRREEEEEKLKRLKEQKEEREKRLQLQQEQKLREKQWEEQKRVEEEKTKEQERLAQLEEEERIKKAEAAALKKKLELEAKRKKHLEKMEKMRKKAEMEREALKKQRMEEKRIAKEEEEKRKLEAKRAKKEKLRLEREKAIAEREELFRAREEETQRLRLQELEQEKEAEKLEAAKKKEALLLEKLKEKQAREKELENLRKLKAAEERIKALQTGQKENQLPPAAAASVPGNTALDRTFTLNNTHLKDESMNNYDMTPRGPDRPLLPSTATNYNIDDFCSDDSTDDEDRPKKVVPKWAKGALLHAAVVKQYTDPPDLDKLFPNLLDAVNLQAIFQRYYKHPKERYYKRTSSAQWNSPVMPPGHISFTQQCKGF